MLTELTGRVSSAVRGWSPEWRDCAIYGLSAAFAGITALAAGITLYQQWGAMAVGPYAAAALLMAVVARRASRARRRSALAVAADGAPSWEEAPPAAGATGMLGGERRWQAARIVACVIALFGATIVPLSLEVVWRTQGDAAAHVQPEVVVVERAGAEAAQGLNPYRVIDRHGHIVIHQTAEPVYELYYPYLPGMVLFGFSSDTRPNSKFEARLTDARIQFLFFTAVIGLLVLGRVRPPSDARYRALQALTVLPTAALPLATGGDDMPVVALMLAGMVALQRRRPVLAGLALGAASSLKFTAWPLAVLALWAALDRDGRRRIGRYVLGLLVVVVPIVAPFAIHSPSAFIDNVIRFPLGLAGVASPAASPLPGHLFVTAFPAAHHVYVAVAGVVGLAVLVARLLRRPPGDAAGVARLAGWVMLVAILLAPATRVGYLLYPVNLFVWSWMLGRSTAPRPRERAVATDAVDKQAGTARLAGALRGLRASGAASPT